jgi:glycosyltransferase involved in cell wall biosynthesis
MKDPFFSVVIPTYNRALLVQHTIESVRKQTYRHFEIIVVDNHSTDDTVEVLRPLYACGIITYIRNEKNYERAYSRNVGFKNAKGDYVTLLDSDDILYPFCLEDAVAYIRQHPQAHFFHGLFELVNDAYKPTGRPIPYPKPGNDLKALMQGNFISNIAVFYKKEVVEKVQFDENPVLTGVEDYDFVIRVLAETRWVGRINKIIAGVLEHPNRSVNLEQWERTYTRINYLLQKHLHSPEFLACYGPYKQIFVSHLQSYLSGFLAVRGKTVQAFRFLFKAVKSDFSFLFSRKFGINFLIILKYMFK